MSELDDIRSKIGTQAFDRLGSSATLYTFVSYTNDKWDNTAVYSSTATTITVIPYAMTAASRLFEGFGDMKSGELTMLIKYSETLNEKGKDKIVYDGETYVIMDLKKYPLLDGNVAYSVRLAKLV